MKFCYRGSIENNLFDIPNKRKIAYIRSPNPAIIGAT